jgi:hypothetical protein
MRKAVHAFCCLSVFASFLGVTVVVAQGTGEPKNQDVPGKMPRISFVPEEIDFAYSEKWAQTPYFIVAKGGGFWTRNGLPTSPTDKIVFSHPVKAITFGINEETTYFDILRAARVFDRGLAADGKLTIYLTVRKKPNNK